MVELEKTFHEVSGDADGLDMDQFVHVFETVLGDKHLKSQNNSNNANLRKFIISHNTYFGGYRL